jgi:plastocyanin
VNTTAAHRPATRVILVSLALAARAWTLDAGAGQAPSLADVTGAVSVEGRARRDAVVWIQGPAAPETAPAAVVLDQRNLAFAPRMLVVRVGTRVEMPNNDRVFHNVFSFKDGKRFDLGLYPVGTTKVVHFDTPGLSRIFCNIHPNMAAYVLAVDAAYFAVTDERGRFTIRGVPAGPATYHAWRPGAEPLSGRFVVGASRGLEIAWP